MAKCKYLDKCNFYGRYQHTLDKNRKVFINKYCFGCGETYCKRFVFLKENGYAADYNYTPTGGVVIEI